jgi:plasmid replication initiation protein
MFAFSTKYALALYEALCLRRNLTRTEEVLSVDEFREVLSVPPDKLKGFPQFKQSALNPAIEEINALSDFNVEVEPSRQGGQQRGVLIGFRLRWEMKDPEEWDKVMAELLRSKVGRKARVRGTREIAAPALLVS